MALCVFGGGGGGVLRAKGEAPYTRPLQGLACAVRAAQRAPGPRATPGDDPLLSPADQPPPGQYRVAACCGGVEHCLELTLVHQLLGVVEKGL